MAEILGGYKSCNKITTLYKFREVSHERKSNLSAEDAKKNFVAGVRLELKLFMCWKISNNCLGYFFTKLERLGFKSNVCNILKYFLLHDY